ncbi:MAG: hypothetical protein HY821_15685 [Acidobacteria bacterium]|nr:hypothetical protein [Acidobacteriota bacterium]
MLPLLLAFQLAQSPSPMVEHTRAHERQTQRAIPGERIQTKFGEIILPPAARPGKPVALVIHFHGARWLAEQSVRQAYPRAAVLAVQLGSGSRVYGEPFQDAGTLPAVLAALKRPVSRLTLTGWSAGYGAIREILRQPANAALVYSVVLLDGIHSGYDPPEEKRLPAAADLDSFEQFAREAIGGRKRLLILHSEIFPSSFASTTETTDWLLDRLGLRRHAVLRWGSLGMQIVSDTRKGRLRVIGFAGNSAPDHVDHLHALPWALKLVK